MTARLRRPDAAVPIAVFLAGVLLHWLQGRWIASPFLLPDELHAADGARSLVVDARAGTQTLYSLVTAPLWLAGTGTAYGLVKLAGAVAVSAVAFPAYALARSAARAWLAGAAALGAVAAPATLFASAVGPVAFAYPLASAGALLTLRGRYVLAFLALALAAACWPPALWLLMPCALHALVRLWPRPGALVAVSVLGYAGFYAARDHSAAFALAVDRISHVPATALASLGAFALGLGLLPLLAVLARSKATGLLLLALPFLALGSAVESAPLGGRRPAEAVLLLAAPLALAAAAAAVERPRLRRAPLALVGAVLAVALVPGRETGSFDPRAPGLELAHVLGLKPLELGGALLLAWVAGRRGSRAAAVGLAALVAGGLAAGVAVSGGSRSVALPPGRVGVLTAAATPEPVLDGLLFWNRLAEPVSPRLDQRTVDAETGRYSPPVESAPLLLDLGGDRVVGEVAGMTALGPLIRPAQPVRAVESVGGLYGDGWSGALAIYRRFQAPAAGRLDLVVSRAAWGGPEVPGHVTISGVGPTRVLQIHPKQTVKLTLRTPPRPFSVVVDSQTFSPKQFGQADSRQLGVQLSFTYRPE